MPGVFWKRNSNTTEVLLISIPIEDHDLAELPSLCVRGSGSSHVYYM